MTGCPSDKNRFGHRIGGNCRCTGLALGIVRQDLPESWLTARRAAGQQNTDWFSSSDPSDGVGARHHTVPAFYLRRFARGEQIAVRRMADGLVRLQNIANLAQKDFYTVVTEDPAEAAGRPDGRVEQFLQTVEGRGATAIRRIANPLLPARSLLPDIHMDLLLFLSFQFVRGARTRREQELIADLSFKMQSQIVSDDAPAVSVEEIAKLRIVGHQNEYIRLLGDMAQLAMEALVERPIMLVELDRPALFTSDEPVLLRGGRDQGHTADCFLSEKQRRRRARRAFAAGATSAGDLVHVRTTRPRNIHTAQEVVFPLDPRRALMLGPRGFSGATYRKLTGGEADSFSKELVADVLSQAYLWIAGHPDSTMLPGIELPAAGPLVELCDGNSAFARDLRTPPSPRNPNRFRRDWT